MGKKIKVGWFSFSCCEDSSIVFTELLNDHFFEWNKIMEFRHIRILKRNNKIEGLDVAFVEGAIASEEDAKKLREIRKNCKKLVAVGSCACTGGPSAQRNLFNEEQMIEVELLMKKFRQSERVYKLEELVKVDEKVPGCPMQEEKFLEVLEKIKIEFGIK